MTPFIEHPRCVPVSLCATSARPFRNVNSASRHNGGIELFSHLGYMPGTALEVRVCIEGQQLCYRGLVVWRRHTEAGYELGLVFASDRDAFRARMVEQLCHIEAWRRRHTGSGIPVEFEMAAAQWIARQSAGFPPLRGCDSMALDTAQPTVAVS